MLFDIENRLFNDFLKSDSEIKEWTSIRATVLRSLAEVSQYDIGSVSGGSLKTKINWRMIPATLFSIISIIKFIFFSNKNYEIIFFSDVKNFLNPDDSDFLFKDIEKANKKSKILVISTFIEKIPNQGKIDYLNIFIIRYFYYLFRVLAKLRSLFKKHSIFIKLLAVLKDFNFKKFDHNKLNEKIINVIYQKNFLNYFFLKVLRLDLIRVEKFIFEDGFMSRNSAIIKSLNQKKIMTVEYQHGAIYSGHEAYNTHPNLVSLVKKQKMIPGILWTFGEEWINCSNLCESDSILGVPWHDAVKKKFKQHNLSSRILILSDGIDTQEYIKLAKRLSDELKLRPEKNLNCLNINLRLHPSENYNDKALNIPYSKIEDIWDDIYRSDIIIACVSTCLYQASFVKKQPIIWLNGRSKYAYNGKYPFPKAENLSELLELVIKFYSSNSIQMKKDVDFFKPYKLDILLN